MIRALYWITACGFLALAGCSDSPAEPTSRSVLELRPLEAVPFDAIGPGKLVFFREWSLTGTGETPPDAVYVIEGTARRSWATYLGFDTPRVLGVDASPNGARVLITTFELGSSQPRLSVANLREGAIGAWSVISDEMRAAVWTPSSDRIVVAWSPNDYDFALFSQLPAANATRTRLFPGTAPLVGLGTCENSLHRLGAPASVSATGAILMTCGDSAIYVIDPGADLARRVYGVPAGPGSATLSSPSWSPDAQRIAFMERTLGTPDEISVRTIRADGVTISTAATLPHAAALFLGADLCWMRDGQRIAFSVGDGNTTHVYIVMASGGVPVQVTSAAGVRDHSLSCPE